MKKKKIIFFVLFFLTTVFIFQNSAKDANESSNQSGFFVAWVMNNMPFLFENEDVAVNVIRKLAHLFEFFLQATFLNLALFSKEYHKMAIYVLFSGLFTGCIDEFIQLYSEGRAGLVGDIFIDFSGTVFSLVIFFILWLLKRDKIKG